MSKKKKKKPPPPQQPQQPQFSVTSDQIMQSLRLRAQYDKELRLHIESAQWEAAALVEKQKTEELQEKLLKLQAEIDKSEDEAGEEQ